jgi:methionyl-tRNA formyltransferase
MRVVFMGSPDFAVPCLRALVDAGHEVALVVSQPDKPAGRGGELKAPAVKTAALSLNLPIIQPKSARTGYLERALREAGAELAVVVAYGKILPKAVLEALPRGCINVHASLLPKYRGAAPIQWAVIDNEPETGVAIMQLDEGMDTGPVLLERRIAIDPDETSGELFERLAPLGASTLIEALAKIDTLVPQPQDHARATHAPMLDKKDGAIDFTQPAAKVAARIRGVDPWPGAQALLRGQVVKLFRARALSNAETSNAGTSNAGTSNAAGTVVSIDATGLHVATGDGVVVIRDIQAPGRKRLSASQFAAGRGVAVGDVLAKPELA